LRQGQRHPHQNFEWHDRLPDHLFLAEPLGKDVSIKPGDEEERDSLFTKKIRQRKHIFGRKPDVENGCIDLGLLQSQKSGFNVRVGATTSPPCFSIADANSWA
jgi:hypothetical protein